MPSAGVGVASRARPRPRARTSTPPRPVSAKSTTRPACSSVSPAPPASAGLSELVAHRVAADLRELVERPQHRARAAGKAQRLEHAVEDLAVVEGDREVGHAGRGEGRVDHLGDLGVGQRRSRCRSCRSRTA